MSDDSPFEFLLSDARTRNAVDRLTVSLEIAGRAVENGLLGVAQAVDGAACALDAIAEALRLERKP